MMPRFRSYASDAGFTLIETLLSMALLAIIAGGLTLLTAQWLPQWNRGFSRIQRTENLALALRRVTADLASAEFMSVGAAPALVQFDGREGAVAFVRTAIGPQTRPGLDIVRYAQSTMGGAPAVIRDRARWTASAAGLNVPKAEPVVVLSGAYRLVLSYAGPDGVWQPEWHDRAELPRQIRLSVRDAVTQQALAVSTVIVVHVDAAAECARAKNVAQCVRPQPDRQAQAAPGGEPL